MSAFLEPLLRCTRCSGETEWRGDRGACSSCGEPVRKTPAGVYEFLPGRDSSAPAPPLKDPTDQANWSKWRSQNYDYLNEKLGGLEDSSVVLPGVSIVADLMKRLPLASDAVDAVVLSNTLDHVPEPEALLEECRRVLRSGGALLIVVPFLIRLHQVPHDFLRYTRYMLEYLLAKTRSTKVEVREMGDIFDVHEVILRDLYVVLKKNLESAKPSAEARDIRKRVLSPFLESVRRDIEALPSLCGDDLDVLGDQQYPHGYGAVAYK
jgi:SAM-dependent methyltransferase